MRMRGKNVSIQNVAVEDRHISLGSLTPLPSTDVQLSEG